MRNTVNRWYCYPIQEDIRQYYRHNIADWLVYITNVYCIIIILYMYIINVTKHCSLQITYIFKT